MAIHFKLNAWQCYDVLWKDIVRSTAFKLVLVCLCWLPQNFQLLFVYCYKTLMILIYHFVDPPVAAPLVYQQSWWQQPYCEDDARYRDSNYNLNIHWDYLFNQFKEIIAFQAALNGDIFARANMHHLCYDIARRHVDCVLLVMMTKSTRIVIYKFEIY